jgi:hypothetical protein
MVARWALVPVDGSAAWSDLALADAWFGKGISDADAALANPPAGFAAQYAAVRAAAEAASNAYRAANVAPPADPDYGGLLDYWYGGVTNLETDDATHQRMGRLVARSAGHVVHRGEAKRRIVEFWRALGKGALGTSADPLCDVAVRVALGERAQVLEFCVGAGPAGDGLCAFDGLFMGCAEYRDGAGPFNEGCAPPTWDTLRWHDPPRVGIGAGDNCRVAKCLPPLRWSLEFLAAVLRRGATRGAAGVLRDAWLFSVARNAATLRRYNLLPAELVDAAAHIPADVTAATWADPATKTAAGVLALAAAAAAAVNPVAGAVVGIAAAVAAIWPRAIGVETDAFGRALPVYEFATLDALDPHHAPHTPPNQDVPDPPFFVRGAPGGVLLPGFIGLTVTGPGAGAPAVPPPNNAAPAPTGGATRAVTDGTTTTGSAWVPWAVGGVALAAAVGGAVMVARRRRRRASARRR